MTRNEFVQKYAQITRLAVLFNEKSRREGLLSLESEIKNLTVEDDRDIFKYGITLAVDGIAAEFTDRLLTNLVNQENDEQKRVLKTIQREAVLMIQLGYNARLMAQMLNSYTDIPLSENEAITDAVYNELSTEAKAEELPVTDDTGKLNGIDTLEDRDIQTIMRNLDSEVLALALKGAGKNARDAFFRNMSERAASMLKEDIKYIGKVSLSGIEEAQDKILTLIERLRASGDINND